MTELVTASLSHPIRDNHVISWELWRVAGGRYH